MYSINDIKKTLQKNSKKIRIVFPEGNEEKIQEVAKILLNEDLAKPILLFEKDSQLPKSLDKNIECISIEKIIKDDFVKTFVELRKGKVSETDAIKLISQTNYYGAMMMHSKQADAMVCGLTFTTADTLRPALQIIKTAPQYSIASSVFVMTKNDNSFIFTDCALNIKPDSKQLSDIAKMAGEFAIQMDVKNPQVALLSYSTKGSGAGEDVEKVRTAFEILNEQKNNEIIFDGELQFDSAFDKEVRLKKSPNSKITKNHPDVFVFPDINAGNIGYKIAQRMGDYQAAGPFILGLNKPINDLSRGATQEDIFNTAIITALQAMKGDK